MKLLTQILYECAAPLAALNLLTFFPMSLYAQETTTVSSPKPTVTEPKQSLLEKTGYLGGTVGVAQANHDVGTGMGYGGEIAFFPQSYFGVGALYRGGVHGTPDSKLWAGELMLRPVGTFALGLVLGAAKLDDASADSGTSFAYGGRVSYDFRLGRTPFSAGPEVDWTFFKPGSNTISDLAALAALKLWL